MFVLSSFITCKFLKNHFFCGQNKEGILLQKVTEYYLSILFYATDFILDYDVSLYMTNNSSATISLGKD